MNKEELARLLVKLVDTNSKNKLNYARKFTNAILSEQDEEQDDVKRIFIDCNDQSIFGNNGNIDYVNLYDAFNFTYEDIQNGNVEFAIKYIDIDSFKNGVISDKINKAFFDYIAAGGGFDESDVDQITQTANMYIQIIEEHIGESIKYVVVIAYEAESNGNSFTVNVPAIVCGVNKAFVFAG